MTSVDIDYYRRVVGGWEEQFTSATTPIIDRRGLLSTSTVPKWAGSFKTFYCLEPGASATTERDGEIHHSVV